MRLKGKNALVTAAGQGIGRASALALAAEGAQVWATDVNEQLLASYAGVPNIQTAALDGQVISRCRQRRRHTEWLKFLRQTDCETPKDRALRLVADNFRCDIHSAALADPKNSDGA